MDVIFISDKYYEMAYMTRSAYKFTPYQYVCKINEIGDLVEYWVKNKFIGKSGVSICMMI